MLGISFQGDTDGAGKAHLGTADEAAFTPDLEGEVHADVPKEGQERLCRAFPFAVPPDGLRINVPHATKFKPEQGTRDRDDRDDGREVGLGCHRLNCGYASQPR